MQVIKMYVQQNATMTVHVVHNKMLGPLSFMETALKKLSRARAHSERSSMPIQYSATSPLNITCKTFKTESYTHRSLKGTVTQKTSLL